MCAALTKPLVHISESLRRKWFERQVTLLLKLPSHSEPMREWVSLCVYRAGNLMCSFCGYLRYLLVFLGLLACGMDYMLRYNISVAIVSMVNNSATYSINSSYACPAAFNASSDAQRSTVTHAIPSVSLALCCPWKDLGLSFHHYFISSPPW